MAKKLDLDVLERVAVAARDGIVRSHGWAGTVEMADLLGKDEAFVRAASPESVVALIARIRELEAAASTSAEDKRDAERVCEPGERRLAFLLPEGGNVIVTFPCEIEPESLNMLAKMLIEMSLRQLKADAIDAAIADARGNSDKGDC